MPPEASSTFINSGATTLDATGRSVNSQGEPCMKPSWEMTEADVEACLKGHHMVSLPTATISRGGGFSSNFLTRGGMPVTMSRLNLVKGLGPVLQIAEGWTVDIDPEINKVLDKRTDPTWPTTWFVPRLCPGRDAFKDVYSVMNNWGANHGAISYGHIGADPLITLASILRIPVCMHNVTDAEYSVRRHGTRSAWIKRVPTIALARTTARFINNKLSARSAGVCHNGSCRRSRYDTIPSSDGK